MEKRTSAAARISAAIALAVAVVATVVVISGAVGGNSTGNGQTSTARQTKKEPGHRRTGAATYEIQGGDTLTSIAHKTGVSIAEIERLNPETDPQLLIAGETLKLR